MNSSNVRLEVMQTIEKTMDEILTKYLKPIETNWQPADLLPDARDENFFEEVKGNMHPSPSKENTRYHFYNKLKTLFM